MGRVIITKELAYRLKVLCDTATADSSRPILTTVHVETHAEKAFFVAADGYRLSAVCLPVKIETEDSFTLQIDAKMLKKLLKAEVDLTVNPTGLTINGISLPTLDVGQCYPDWRTIIPHNTEPRANMTAFMLKYSIEFLKFRLGKGYNKTTGSSGYNTGLPTFSLMHYSIYDEDKCGMASPHAWTWAEPYDGSSGSAVYFLHVLMPIRAMKIEPLGSFDTEVTEEQIETFNKGSNRLTELLEERFHSTIKNVTESMDEVWNRPEKKKEE